MSILQYTILYTICCILYTIYYILYTIYYMLYTTCYILHYTILPSAARSGGCLPPLCPSGSVAAMAPGTDNIHMYMCIYIYIYT